MDFDTIIVGGGHNGLVAAHYLAEAGLKVLILERASKLGGACSTDELFPGYHFSTCAHSFVLFHPKFVDDMRLKEYGLHVLPRDPIAFHPFTSGKHLLFWGAPEQTIESIGRISADDSAAYPRWQEFWRRAGAIFEPFLLREPPSFAEFASRYEGTRDKEIFNKIMFGTVRGLLNEYFESDEVKSALASTLDSGSTYAPGSLLYGAFHASVSHQIAAHTGIGYPRGGMGSVAQAMQRSIESQGVTIQTGAAVECILVRDGRAIGVRLADGTEVTAQVVISNADPRRTFLKLIDRDVLAPRFVEQVQRLHALAGYMKLHCAVNGLPDWRVLPGTGPSHHHFAQASLGRSLDGIDQAWSQAQAGRMPDQCALALVVPSLYDPELAPPDHHTLTIWVEYAPIRPRNSTWDELRESVTQKLIAQVAEHAPNFPDIIEKSYLYTPVDMEARMGLTDGSMHHVDMTPDQMLDQRPLPSCANYRTPIRNLYLCGSGSHPGGGVTGMPGHNAAQAVIQDWDSRAKTQSSKVG